MGNLMEGKNHQRVRNVVTPRDAEELPELQRAGGCEDAPGMYLLGAQSIPVLFPQHCTSGVRMLG